MLGSAIRGFFNQSQWLPDMEDDRLEATAVKRERIDIKLTTVILKNVLRWGYAF